MPSPLEQLKALELKANFTPRERQYFYKLRDELESIVGGVSIAELKKPSDVVRARKIRAKLEEILKFVQDRKIEVDIEKATKDLVAWLKIAHIDGYDFQGDSYWEDWIENNVEFKGEQIIIKVKKFECQTGLTFLPDNLVFLGSLILERCSSINRLPAHLVVKGELNVFACESLVDLPDDLFVGKILVVHKANRGVIDKAHLLKARGQIKGDVWDY
jgi:hypothetical protein